jgi:hypothetical protein
MHFMDLPQHVSASYCHHQGVVVSSEATQAVCMVDVYGLRPVQSGQLSRDVTKRVHAWLHPTHWLFYNNTTKMPGPTIKITCSVIPVLCYYLTCVVISLYHVLCTAALRLLSSDRLRSNPLY